MLFALAWLVVWVLSLVCCLLGLVLSRLCFWFGFAFPLTLLCGGVPLLFIWLEFAWLSALFRLVLTFAWLYVLVWCCFAVGLALTLLLVLLCFWLGLAFALASSLAWLGFWLGLACSLAWLMALGFAWPCPWLGFGLAFLCF